MHTLNTSTPPPRERASFARESDINEFAEALGRFERGEIGADVWRAFRLVRGTYGQRQTGDAQMLRVKAPQGLLTAPQLEALAEGILADLARAYSDGGVRVTREPNVVFRWVRQETVRELYLRLAAASPGYTKRWYRGRRRELPGSPVVPARSHPVARPRPCTQRPPAGTARSDRGCRRPADQDQRMPDSAMPIDFVDLGETQTFAPEVLDGECSA